MIKRFKEFSSSLVMNEAKNVTFNELEKFDKMKAGDYLRNAMWDKSIKLFYGNNYKGNPETDNRMVPSVSASSSRDRSFGDVFKDAWDETNDFCNFGSYQAVFVFDGAGSTSSRVQKTVSGLDPNVVLGWLTASGIKVVPSDPSIFDVQTTMEDAAANIAKQASTFFSKRTIKVDEVVSSLGKRIGDRDKTIKTVKANIERESDFETDWGLDSWLPYVTEMPGWGKVYQVEADKLGYWYSWEISQLVFRFAEIKFGVAILKAAQAMIKAGQITPAQINSTTVQPAAASQPTVQPTPQAPAQAQPAPGPTPAAPTPKRPIAQKAPAGNKYSDVSLK